MWQAGTTLHANDNLSMREGRVCITHLLHHTNDSTSSRNTDWLVVMALVLVMISENAIWVDGINNFLSFDECINLMAKIQHRFQVP